MYIPKRYGQSKIENCTFCDKRGLLKNTQGLIVCSDHRNKVMDDLKCACGNFLELRQGKFGPFYTCMNCGIISIKKAQEMQGMQKKEKVQVRKETKDDFIVDPGKYPGFDYGID
jgi:hypothetical protein